MIHLRYRRFQVHTPATQEPLNHGGLEPMHARVGGKPRIGSSGCWIRPRAHWFLAIKQLAFLFPAEKSKTIQAHFALFKKKTKRKKEK